MDHGMTEQLNVQQMAQRLMTADNILILCHKNPDGDTIGCGSALYCALKALDKNVAVLCSDAIPNRYAFTNAHMFKGEFEPQTVVAVDVASVQLFLPEKIYVAQGVTLELYNSQVSSLGTRIEDYNVKWTCAVGKNMQRKFSITGTEELLGEYPLIFTIFDDNGTQVATTSTTLKIVEDLGEQEKSFSLLTIGDSLSCNTATYEELNTLTDNQIVYMGTRGVGGSLTEARRGFSAANYLTDSPYTMEDPHEEVHPFYNEETGSFDWNYYKKKTGFHPDAVELFLGTNGLDVDPVENGDNIIKIVKKIHEDEPKLPIYLVHTIYPANQDGIGSWNNKGYALYSDRYKYEEDQKVFNTEYGSYKVYDIDRSVCDCVRFKNDIPKEIFDLIIEKYKKYDKRSTERLMAYAKAMRISRQVEQIGLE